MMITHRTEGPQAGLRFIYFRPHFLHEHLALLTQTILPVLVHGIGTNYLTDHLRPFECSPHVGILCDLQPIRAASL